MNRSSPELVPPGVAVDPKAINPDVLALLIVAKQQIEEDAVKIDHLVGWCRTLPRLIDQDGMPKAWDKIVAYLEEHGHAV